MGLGIKLSESVVETFLPRYDLNQFLDHQLRWARTIRDSRPGGYAGLLATFGLPWALLALLCSRGADWAWALAGSAILMRYGVALVVGRMVLMDKQVTRWLALIPLRDFVGVLIWLAGFGGHTVSWRGDLFELKDGKLVRMQTAIHLPRRRRQQLETAVGVETITASAPHNRISKKSCQPEAEGSHVLDRQAAAS